jgi:glutathione S-transferase
MIKLIGLNYSPWTQRAKWALEARGISYHYTEYVPGLGEPMLRWRMRNLSGVAQVPVLFADGAVVAGSGAIARFIAPHGELGDFARTQAWEELADAATSEARMRVVRRSLASLEVQEEATAGVIPRPLRKQFRWLARGVMRGLERKYAGLAREGAMREALTRARAELRERPFLLGQFSYADIALASSLEMVEPIVARGPATREAWTWRELADEFADLLAWRRELREHARHQPLAA